ncbi:binding-protein-dependent transport system inner membrane component, partial [Rhodobacter viridis]
GAGELVGGSVLAETIFAWPGLGQATVRAATGADAPLLLGIALATLLIVFCGNLLADIAARLADPRLREMP